MSALGQSNVGGKLVDMKDIELNDKPMESPQSKVIVLQPQIVPNIKAYTTFQGDLFNELHYADYLKSILRIRSINCNIAYDKVYQMISYQLNVMYIMKNMTIIQDFIKRYSDPTQLFPLPGQNTHYFF